jgi:hypothetical protein
VEHHDLTLERRLRAARPRAAAVDEIAFDRELLDRVRTLPIDRRRTVPRTVALPVAAGATLAVAAVLMFGGGPGHVGGPSAAAAITQTLHWLNPPAGTVLHVRSVATQDGRTTTREYWQSADRPEQAREVVDGAQRLEVSGDALYDPVTDTIYEGPAARDKRAGGKVDAGGMPASDPIVRKVRLLLQAGNMEVTGREAHSGTDAWAVSLKQGVGRPVWTLWVSAADGKPLELRDPGRDASEAPQVIRWAAYEVLPARDAEGLVTLRGAHPSARVVRDPEQVAAAEQRLGIAKP